VRVTQVSSLRPNLSDKVTGKVSGMARKWREYVETSATVIARFENGDAAFTAKGKHHYLPCAPDEKLLASVMGHVCKNAGLKTIKLPAHIRLRKRGSFTFAFNYGTKVWSAPAGVKMLLGKRSIPPQSLGIWTSKLKE
jgi:beta-galactosidase